MSLYASPETTRNRLALRRAAATGRPRPRESLHERAGQSAAELHEVVLDALAGEPLYSPRPAGPPELGRVLARRTHLGGGGDRCRVPWAGRGLCAPCDGWAALPGKSRDADVQRTRDGAAGRGPAARKQSVSALQLRGTRTREAIPACRSPFTRRLGARCPLVVRRGGPLRISRPPPSASRPLLRDPDYRRSADRDAIGRDRIQRCAGSG